MAVGLFTRFKEAGVRIPEDVALVGFSDNPETALTDPGLTTVFQPASEMGRTAVSLLLRQIEEEDDFKPETVVLETELLVRGSSAPRGMR